MTAFFLADSLKTKQEALALLDERKNKKMDSIERLQRLMRDETDDEMKALFKNQLKEAMRALAALDAEEQVLT
jgi:protein subunit release factor A